MLKKLSYGIMIGLLACNVITGCGGGDKKGGSASGGSTPAATTSVKKADAELKFGSYTAKMYKVENSAMLFMQNRNNRPKRLTIDGKYVYAMNEQKYLAKLLIDTNKKTLTMDNPTLASGLWENAQLSANGYGVFFVKNSRPYFLAKSGTKEVLAYGEHRHIEAIDDRNGYAYMNQNEVHKVELKTNGIVGKKLGVVRPDFTVRRGGKDNIGANAVLLSDRDGFYCFGQAIESRSVGRGVYYDKNNKLVTYYGPSYNNSAPTQDKGYIGMLGDAVVTDRYVLMCDRGKALVNLYDKKSGRCHGALTFSEVGGPNTTYISMATIERNKVLVVAGNPNDKQKLDRLWIMEL